MRRTSFNFALLGICCSLATLTANAESTSPETTPRSRWAVEVQYDLNMPGDWRTTDRNQNLLLSSGVGVGAACNVNLSQGWFIEPGALIAYDTFKFGDNDDRLRLMQLSLRIPIKAGYEFNAWDEFRILPHIAVEGAYHLYNKAKFNPVIGSPKWNRFDTLWGIGVGFRYESYGVDLTGYFGLIDKLSNASHYQPQYKQYSNKVAITAKYYF